MLAQDASEQEQVVEISFGLPNNWHEKVANLRQCDQISGSPLLGTQPERISTRDLALDKCNSHKSHPIEEKFQRLKIDPTDYD